MRQRHGQHAQAPHDAGERRAVRRSLLRPGGVRRGAHAFVTSRNRSSIALSAPIEPHFSTMSVRRISWCSEESERRKRLTTLAEAIRTAVTDELADAVEDEPAGGIALRQQLRLADVAVDRQHRADLLLCQRAEHGRVLRGKAAEGERAPRLGGQRAGFLRKVQRPRQQRPRAGCRERHWVRRDGAHQSIGNGADEAQDLRADAVAPRPSEPLVDVVADLQDGHPVDERRAHGAYERAVCRRLPAATTQVPFGNACSPSRRSSRSE